jgi:surfactin synthase thioesterase subunit
MQFQYAWQSQRHFHIASAQSPKASKNPQLNRIDSSLLLQAMAKADFSSEAMT